MKTTRRLLIVLAAVCILGSFKNKELTWVAIGDSITYLNDHLNETGNRVTKGYLTDVIDKLKDIRYVNKGYNGWTAVNIADRIDTLRIPSADIYSVFLGTNDWWQGKPLGTLQDYRKGKGTTTTYGSFRIIINKLRQLNPRATIVLITPMQRADFVYINNPQNNAYGSYKPKKEQNLESFANAVDSIGGYEHIPVIDLYHNKNLPVLAMVNFKRLKDPLSGIYRNYPFPQSTTITYNHATDDYPYPAAAINLTYDGLHPSDKGNSIIAGAIISQFKKCGIR